MLLHRRHGDSVPMTELKLTLKAKSLENKQFFLMCDQVTPGRKLAPARAYSKVSCMSSFYILDLPAYKYHVKFTT